MRRFLSAVLALAPLASIAIGQSNTDRMANDRYSRSHDYALTHERIELSHFDWDSTSFDGVVTLHITALRPGLDSIIVDAGSLLRIASVTDKGGALTFARHGDTLVVRPRKPLAFRDSLNFRIAYHGVVSNGDGLTFFFADSGASPHPQQIWSQGEDISNHRWFPTYDAPNNRLTWEMVVTVPKPYTVVSNGALVSDVPAGTNEHTVTWRLDKPSSSYLASIVVAPLTKLNDSWKGHPVDYYVYRGSDTAMARRLFAETPDQIAVYSKLTGVDYPWNKYAQTTVADFFGGMENVTATTLVDWIPDATAYLDRPWYHHELIAHELAHQWFGDFVTTEDWANIWLNEGFATFMVGPYWREKQGAHAAEDYYLNEYQQFMGIDRRRRMPIAALGSNNIYPKGALALEMLRKHLGDQRFWAGVHRYLVDHAYGNATTDDFRQAMLDATGENLSSFMDEWFYQAGYPEFSVSATYDSTARRLTLSVQQTQTDSSKADSAGLRYTTPDVFRMPVTVRVAVGLAERTQRAWLDQRSQSITFDSLGGAPTMVIFDDGNTILKTLTFPQPTAWLAEQLARDEDIWNRWWAIGQLVKRDSDAAAGAALARAATRADYFLTRAQAAEALGVFPASVAVPALTQALSDTSAAVRVAALRGLRTLGGDSAHALARAMFARDKSYEVRAAAVRALIAVPFAQQRALVLEALRTWSYRDVIGTAALLTIAGKGDTTLLAAVDSQVPKLQSAAFVLAAYGRHGSAHAYDLLAAQLTSPWWQARSSARQAFERAVPKSIAMAMVTRARDRASDPWMKGELTRLLPRIADRPDDAP